VEKQKGKNDFSLEKNSNYQKGAILSFLFLDRGFNLTALLV
jgi:hypothetical protein